MSSLQSVEVEGDSIDAAIANALRSLGVPRERVAIEILANASRGLFGLGGRKARVRATVRPPLDGEDLFAPPPAAARSDQSVPVSPASLPAAPADGGPERAVRILAEIVRHIGVEAGVTARPDGDHVVLEIEGDTSGVLIGRRGQMLDALEYIVNRAMARDDEASARYVIDSQDYRARRRAALEEMARRMADEARRRARPVTLNPMSPRDRRIVHLVLQGDDSLTTRSAGKGYYRKLVIIPEGGRRPARRDA